MARQERATRKYITWLPFLVDSVRWTRQGWHISEQERLPPKWKIFAPISFAFPKLRVTYERIVPGGIWHPDEYREAQRLAAEMLSRDPSLANDPALATFFISTQEEPKPPETPLPPDSTSPQPVPPIQRPLPPPPVPAEEGGHEA